MKRLFSIRSRLNNEKGVTLVMVMMVLVVLSVLGLGILGMAVNNVYTTGTERDYQAAYYIAEAGAALKYSEIEKAVHDYHDSSSAPAFYGTLEANILRAAGPYTDFESSFGESPSADITVTKGEQVSTNSRNYIITSEGTIGLRKRTVKREITINWSKPGGGGIKLPADMAVYTETVVDLSGGALIDGNTGTNMADADTIRLDGGASIKNGKIYVPSGYENKAIKAPDYIKNNLPEPLAHEKMTMNLPDFPEYPVFSSVPDKIFKENATWKLDENKNIKNLTLTANTTLDIDTGNSDKAIVVEHLNVTNGHINILGSGSLTFYVKDKITMGSGSTINNNASIEKVKIYLKGSGNSSSPKSVTLSGSQKIFGSLYAEDARIHLTAGGGFQGHILTGGKNVTIDGGTRNGTLILAPKARVYISGGGTVNGAIYSHNLVGDGGASAVFKKIDFSSIPFGSGNNSGTNPADMIITKPITEISK